LIEEQTSQSLTRRDNVVELQNAISWYQKSAKNASLTGFLQEVSLITDADKYDEDKPAVTLMTVHGSKGLEFPVVFISGLEENLFPMGARNGEEADIEEERRLFYVAITRAKKDLYFSYSKIRSRFGDEQRQMRSRFLNEVDAGVVRTESGSTIRQSETGPKRPGRTASGSTTIEYEPGFESEDVEDEKENMDSTTHWEVDDDPFHSGANVLHPKFGPGKIMSRSGSGRDSRVVVFFKNRGRKTLMLRAANLKILK
ncbi:MAG: 3'-5' exonuclease, partial [Balneolaceae bacterium]